MSCSIPKSLVKILKEVTKQDVGQKLFVFDGNVAKSRLRTAGSESETEIRKKRSEKADGGRKDGADGAKLTYFRKLTAKGRRTERGRRALVNTQTQRWARQTSISADVVLSSFQAQNVDATMESTIA